MYPYFSDPRPPRWEHCTKAGSTTTPLSLFTYVVVFLQAVGWVVGFVMGDFTYTVMGWAAGVVLSLIVSEPSFSLDVGLGLALKVDKGVHKWLRVEGSTWSKSPFPT